MANRNVLQHFFLQVNKKNIIFSFMVPCWFFFRQRIKMVKIHQLFLREETCNRSRKASLISAWCPIKTSFYKIILFLRKDFRVHLFEKNCHYVLGCFFAREGWAKQLHPQIKKRWLKRFFKYNIWKFFALATTPIFRKLFLFFSEALY